MGARHNRARLLWAAATDATFELMVVGPERARVLCGKCIHCGRRHQLELDGTPRTRATVEHIVPRHHGGGDTVENLAVACAGCNQRKGARLDARPWHDPDLQRVIATLSARRRERWRAPLATLDLPASPEAVGRRTGDTPGDGSAAG